MKGLRDNAKWLGVIAGLMVAATIAGGYILINQRLPNPFEERYTVRAEFSTAAGLNPGLGQAVNVAGVRVGTISGVELKDGLADVKLEIDPGKLKTIYNDAHAVFVPNTPLKDMLVELFPGHASAGDAPKDAVIPVSRTSPPVDSDELTAALDTDTRRFFQILVNGVDKGLDGRAADLQALLKELQPTAKQLGQVSGALAARRKELRRLVSSMARLTSVTAAKDGELAQLVVRGDQTVNALASQDAALRTSIAKLPSTLQTTSATLDNLRDFSARATPTLDGLVPVLRKLPPALKAADGLMVTAEPVLRKDLRPLTRQLVPVAKDLQPTTRDLSAVTPSLTSAFKVLNYVVNELAYNPEGDNEGFLFWLSWFAHNGNSFTSTQDANGPGWRGLAIFSCNALTSSLGPLAPIVNNIIGSSPVCK